MFLGVILGALAGLASGDGSSTNAEPAQVMVLGTYHFDNPNLDLNNARAEDVLTLPRQKELEALAQALETYKPTKILVERVAKTSALIDPNYASFTPSQLMNDRDERVQIGYRLAARLAMDTVYAIDEQPRTGEPDYFPFTKVTAWSEANGAQGRIGMLMKKGAAATRRLEQLQRELSIPAVLSVINQRKHVEAEQGIYYALLDIGDTEDQPGADLNAMWYLRNAKIFAKLQKVAEPGDRLLVIYGSGHTYWLRHFAATVPGYVDVDPLPFLSAATAAETVEKSK